MQLWLGSKTCPVGVLTIFFEQEAPSLPPPMPFLPSCFLKPAFFRKWFATLHGRLLLQREQPERSLGRGRMGKWHSSAVAHLSSMQKCPSFSSRHLQVVCKVQMHHIIYLLPSLRPEIIFCLSQQMPTQGIYALPGRIPLKW